MNQEEHETLTRNGDSRVVTLEPETRQPSKKDRFFQVAPAGAFFLDAADPAGVTDYLATQSWLESGELLASVRLAGQGNMNYLVRVRTNFRTFILKQSRPWVEKYSEISAPFDRALSEARFYGLLAGTPTAEFMPRLHWVDEESRILCLEDLGTCGDWSNLYGGARLSRFEQQQLLRFLSLLHNERGLLANRGMRLLNHFHIFVFPFQKHNGLDLDGITPGLQRLADVIKTNNYLQDRVNELGKLYLEDGRYLLHGDYFPGSWLRTKYGLKIIDPEFGFTGPREFDFGVLSAHLHIGGTTIEPSVSQIYYAHSKELDTRLVSAFAGVETLRRLLGVAQLPIAFDLERKRSLVEEAVHELLA